MAYRCWFTVAARQKHYLEIKEQRGSITAEEMLQLNILREKLHKMFNRMRA